MKLFLTISLMLIIITITPSFASTYISEINFINDEFLEIYSDTNINLSNSTIYDSNLDRYNTLSFLKSNNNSNYYLIAGSNFISNNNLSQFNCTIYQTDKSQVSNGGLKSSGENIFVRISEGFNLTYNNSQEYTFNENETLNYISQNNSYIINPSTICSGPLFNLNSQITLSPSNSSNITENNSTFPTSEVSQNLSQTSNMSNKCNFKFNITTEKTIFEDKIQFSFDTNATNYTILYWIETYIGEIVKSKRNTSNTNTKSYSPKDKTEIYNIKATLNTQNCIINDSKFIAYHFSQETTVANADSKSSPEINEFNSKIEILNLNDLLNYKTNQLKLYIYRGDTLKRTVYLYFNSKLLHTFEIEKYSDLTTKITLPQFTEEKNSILITGLDLTEEFDIKLKNPLPATQSSKLEETISSDSKKQFFNISNFILKSSEISFDIISNINNLDGQCYIYDEKTLVSTYATLSTIEKIFLKINTSTLTKKKDKSQYLLKLICKYKKSNLKTYNYVSLEFNYSSPLSIVETKSTQYLIQDSSNDIVMSVLKEINPSNNSLQESLSNYVYLSDSQKSKNNSIFLILCGVTLLLSMLIVSW